jgi:hypothetical protein
LAATRARDVRGPDVDGRPAANALDVIEDALGFGFSIRARHFRNCIAPSTALHLGVRFDPFPSSAVPDADHEKLFSLYRDTGKRPDMLRGATGELTRDGDHFQDDRRFHPDAFSR